MKDIPFWMLRNRLLRCLPALLLGLALLTSFPLIAQNTWTAIANMSTSGRNGAVAFTIGPRGYMGLGSPNNAAAAYNDLWEFDPGSGVWTQKANAPAARAVAGAFVAAGKAYVTCGYVSGVTTNTTVEFNPVTNQWTSRANFPGTARYGMTAFGLGAKGYAGLGATGDLATYFTDWYEYDPATDTWAAKATFTGVARLRAASFVIGSQSRGYVLCGSNASGQTIKDCFEYNPYTNAWAARASLTSPSDGLSAPAGFSVGNFGYCVAGFSNLSGYTNATYEFNPVANTWTTRATYPVSAIAQVVGFSLGNRGYAGTGLLSSATVTNACYAYQPAAGLFVTQLPRTTYCPSGALSVSYTSVGITFTGNTFTAQLSDANGNFASPVTIGTLTSNAANGSIACTLPAGLNGKGYRIRVVSSSPAHTGGDNGTELFIATPTGSATPATSTRCFSGSIGIGLSSNFDGATYSWTVSQTGSTVTGPTACSSGCGSTISQSLSLGGGATAAGIVTYTVTPSNGFCSGTTFTTTVTMNPTPVGSASPAAPSTCSGVPFSTAISSNIGTPTFTWTAAQLSGATITGFSNQSSPVSGSISQTLVNSSNVDGVVRYSVTPTFNGCVGTAFNVDVTVKPLPIGSTSSTQTICSGSATNLLLNSNLAGTTYTWTAAQFSGATVSGYSNQSTPVSGPIAQNLTVPSTSQGAVRYIVTPTASGCAGSTFTSTVTVQPKPTGSASPASPSVCSGTAPSISLFSNIVGSTYTWTVSATPGTTGASACSTACGSAIVQTLSNSTATNGTVTYTVVPTVTATGCSGNAFNVPVTVKPIPVGSAGAGSVCNGAQTSVVLNSTVAGTSFTWTYAQLSGSTVSGASNQTVPSLGLIEQTLSVAGSPGTVRYTVTPTAAACTGATFTTDVTVNLRPVATATPSAPTICSGTSPNVSLGSSLSGTAFTWTAPANSTVSGGSPCASGCGGTINQVLNTLTTGYGQQLYEVTPTVTATGCTGSTIDVLVTVNPRPIASASPQSICSGAATSIALSANVVGSSFSWTASLQAGSVTGFSDQLTPVAGPIAQTLTNTINSSGLVRYQVTASYAGCPGTPVDVDATVNPLPFPIVNVTQPNVCSGNATSINLSSVVSGATFAWTASASSGVTGAANCSSGCGNAISQTLNYSGATSGTATYTVTASIAATGCSATASPQVVQVRRLPVAGVSPAAVSVCSGATPSVALSSNITPATYSWTVVESGATGGGSCTGCTGPISNTLTNLGNTNGTVTYQVTAQETTFGCVSAVTQAVVTVYPQVVAFVTTPTDTACSGTVNIPFQCNLANVGYSWTATASPGLSGVFSCSAGCATGINTNFFYNGSGVAQAVYTVSAISFSSGCTSAPFVVTRYVRPFVTGVASSPTVCSGDTAHVTLSSTPAGAMFTWTTSVSGAPQTSGYSNQSTPVAGPIRQVLTNTGTTNGTVTYFVTPILNGCAGSSFVSNVQVKPGPTVTLSAASGVCAGATTPLTASGASSYAWQPGASLSSTTGSSVSATPLLTTTYTVTGTGLNGCAGTKTHTLHAGMPPQIAYTQGNGLLCIGDTVGLLITNSAPTDHIVWQLHPLSVPGWFDIGDPDEHVLPARDPSPGDTGAYLVRAYAPGGYCPDSISGTLTLLVADCAQPVSLDLQLFLQGFYDNSIPGNRPVLYDLGFSTDPTACDSLIIELMDTATLAQVASIPALLHTDGSVDCLVAPAYLGGCFFLRVKHRNVLSAWSADPVWITTSPAYDFALAANSVYGAQQVEVTPARWALWSGDTNGDGLVEATDYSDVENATAAFAFGYVATDLTGDGITEAADYSLIENNALLFLFEITP